MAVILSQPDASPNLDEPMPKWGWGEVHGPTPADHVRGRAYLDPQRLHDGDRLSGLDHGPNQVDVDRVQAGDHCHAGRRG